jgi:cold shock protein
LLVDAGAAAWVVAALTGARTGENNDVRPEVWDAVAETAMPAGTVKWFNDAKGFGFIEPDGGGDDVFAHFSAVQMEGFRTLKQGSRVTYELMQGPKGNLAQNIQAAEGPVAAKAETRADA